MHTVTKSYRDLPAAHRQPKHDGHCRWIHGHSWGFDITFTCGELDENGFVIDVGKLGVVKDFLEDTFDHTLLLNVDDPFRNEITEFVLSYRDDLAKIRAVPNCGMEGLAEYVYVMVVGLIDAESFDVTFRRNLRVVEVTCWEDSKNSATYR